MNKKKEIEDLLLIMKQYLDKDDKKKLSILIVLLQSKIENYIRQNDNNR